MTCRGGARVCACCARPVHRRYAACAVAARGPEAELSSRLVISHTSDETHLGSLVLSSGHWCGVGDEPTIRFAVPVSGPQVPWARSTRRVAAGPPRRFAGSRFYTAGAAWRLWRAAAGCAAPGARVEKCAVLWACWMGGIQSLRPTSVHETCALIIFSQSLKLHRHPLLTVEAPRHVKADRTNPDER